MDNDLKSKWVAALRSGEFVQTHGWLTDCKGGLCCIGVGAVVADKHFDPIGSCTADASDIIGIDVKTQDILVGLNDDDRKSFAEIADYIEQNL